MKIKLTNKKGDWSATETWLKKNKSFKEVMSILEQYGREGVAALSAVTPVDTGNTASSWSYKVENNNGYFSLSFTNNSKTKTGTPIVILLQYGHGNGRGAYIQGRDFINPVIKPIFDEITEKVWKEIVE